MNDRQELNSGDVNQVPSGPERRRDPEWAEAMSWERPVPDTEAVLDLARNGTAELIHEAVKGWMDANG